MKEKLNRIANSAKNALFDEVPQIVVSIGMMLLIAEASYLAANLGVKKGTEEALTYINTYWGNPNA